MLELEKKIELTWPKQVEPLEQLVDQLQVIWGVGNHHEAVEDSDDSVCH